MELCRVVVIVVIEDPLILDPPDGELFLCAGSARIPYLLNIFVASRHSFEQIKNLCCHSLERKKKANHNVREMLCSVFASFYAEILEIKLFLTF